MKYLKTMNFTNATEFVEFIQKNSDLIKNERSQCRDLHERIKKWHMNLEK